MRSPARAALALALAALAGCAARGAAPASACAASFDRADGVLRAALASYVAQMRRFAAARDPGATTAPAEARVLARADAWTEARRPEVIAACRTWPEERTRCVLAAGSPQELSACGLDALVASFTDEVVASFAARPVEVGPAPLP